MSTIQSFSASGSGTYDTPFSGTATATKETDSTSSDYQKYGSLTISVTYTTSVADVGGIRIYKDSSHSSWWGTTYSLTSGATTTKTFTTYSVKDGYSYEYEVWSGSASPVAYKGKITIPSNVASISLGYPASIQIGETGTVYFSLNGYNGKTPETTGVSYSSSNTAIATVTSAGLVTGVSNGSVNITVTTTDKTSSLSETGTASKTQTVTIYITDGSFPQFDDNYDFLSAGLMENIINALIIVANENDITLPYATNTWYTGQDNPISYMFMALYSINADIKYVCTQLGVSNTLPSYPQRQNSGQMWYAMVNEWIDLLEQIHNS